MKKLLTALVFLPLAFLSQTASFIADTSQLRIYTGHHQQLYDRALEMEWKINGKTLHFGSNAIEVKTDSTKPLTIFYKCNKKAKWDTIICLVKEAKEYRFVYNQCCGSFYLMKKAPGGIIKGKVIFHLASAIGNKKFLGTLGEAGILIPTNDTLVTDCRSAMSSNIYPLTLSEIKICKDTNNCEWGICLQDKTKKEQDYNFGYRTVSKKINILFMPLSDEPVEITYDPKKKKITFR